MTTITVIRNITLICVFTMFMASASYGQKHAAPCASSHSLISSRHWISGSKMWTPGVYPSPDKQYYVELDEFDEEGRGIDTIHLYRGRPRTKPHLFQDDLLSHVPPWEVNGLAWVPGRPHTFVFGSRGDPGYSVLGFWNGGRRVRPLLSAGKNRVAPIALLAVSRNGRSIIYSRSDMKATEKNIPKHYLRLPRS